MKLLQVTNVGNIVGGTAACAWTITRALPDWEHAVAFPNCTKETREAFGCEILSEVTQLLPRHFEAVKPDVVLFHNTPEFRMPNLIPDHVMPLYYQHSGQKNAIGARKRCAIFWSVSRWLAARANIHNDQVFYQPVPVPPSETHNDDGVIVVGRINTPTANKWRNVIPLYDLLADRFEYVLWHFIGCPHEIQDALMKACNGDATFNDASWGARRWINSWDAMLYESTLNETYGRTLCESQRAGCVPIMSNHSGFAEQIQHATDGYLCDSHDDFVKAVQFVHDASLRAEVAENAKRNSAVRSSLSGWRDQFLNWIGAYLSVTAEKTVLEPEVIDI